LWAELASPPTPLQRERGVKPIKAFRFRIAELISSLIKPYRFLYSLNWKDIGDFVSDMRTLAAMHKVNRLLLVIILLALSKEVVAQNQYWFRIHNPTKDEYAYVDGNGKIKIPFGRYSICYTDTFKTFAIVIHKKKGFVAINKKEKVLFVIYPFDNGPDEVSSGLFRIIDNGLIGFADTLGNIVIKPRFKSVFPFSENLAAYCEGCITYRMGEHRSWAGGKWGFIDKSGTTRIQPIYDQILEPFKDGRAKVSLNATEIWIDEQGKRL